MQQEPEAEPEAEPDFMITSLSSSVPGNHDVQTLRLSFNFSLCYSALDLKNVLCPQDDDRSL